MRILLISNNYPTVYAPSGAIYITRRVEAHRANGDQVDAFALRPVSSRSWDFLRRRLGLLSNEQLRIPESLTGDDGYLDVPYPVNLKHVLQCRLGRMPTAVLRSAVESLLAQISGKTYDVIHAHGMYDVTAGAVAQMVSQRTGIPYAISVHGSDINVVMPSKAKEFVQILDGATSVAYVSDALRLRARELGSRSRREYIIPNGVDLKSFSPDHLPGVSQGHLGQSVAYVGNLLPIKGVDRLPRIFARMAASCPDLRFVIAGDGPLRTMLERQTRSLDIDFLGRVEPRRVSDVMLSASLLVLPSRNEGFGTVVIESHACGTPVLGSNAGGIPEAIADPNFVIPEGPGFEERFADSAIQVLTGGLRGGDLRARVLGFSWENIAARERAMLQNATESFLVAKVDTASAETRRPDMVK